MVSQTQSARGDHIFAYNRFVLFGRAMRCQRRMRRGRGFVPADAGVLHLPLFAAEEHQENSLGGGTRKQQAPPNGARKRLLISSLAPCGHRLRDHEEHRPWGAPPVEEHVLTARYSIVALPWNEKKESTRKAFILGVR